VTNNAGAAAIGVAPRTPESAIGIATVTAGTTNVASWSSQDMTGAAAAQANFGKVRPVSACLDMLYIGSTQGDSGYMTGILNPPGTGYQTAADVSTWQTSELNTLSDSVRKGMRVLWRPDDNSDFEYVGPTASDAAPVTTAFASNTSPFMAISVVNAQATLPCLKWTLTVNYEAIPARQSLELISTAPSPIDIQGTQRVLQELQSLPATVPLTPYGGPGFSDRVAREITTFASRAHSAYTAYNDIKGAVDAFTAGGLPTKYLREIV